MEDNYKFYPSQSSESNIFYNNIKRPNQTGIIPDENYSRGPTGNKNWSDMSKESPLHQINKNFLDRMEKIEIMLTNLMTAVRPPNLSPRFPPQH